MAYEIEIEDECDGDQEEIAVGRLVGDYLHVVLWVCLVTLLLRCFYFLLASLSHRYGYRVLQCDSS